MLRDILDYYILDSEWEVKPCRGRQRKTWRKVISELLLQLNLDSQEILAEDSIEMQRI